MSINTNNPKLNSFFSAFRLKILEGQFIKKSINPNRDFFCVDEIESIRGHKRLYVDIELYTLIPEKYTQDQLVNFFRETFYNDLKNLNILLHEIGGYTQINFIVCFAINKNSYFDIKLWQ